MKAIGKLGLLLCFMLLFSSAAMAYNTIVTLKVNSIKSPSGISIGGLACTSTSYCIKTTNVAGCAGVPGVQGLVQITQGQSLASVIDLTSNTTYYFVIAGSNTTSPYGQCASPSDASCYSAIAPSTNCPCGNGTGSCGFVGGSLIFPFIAP